MHLHLPFQLHRGTTSGSTEHRRAAVSLPRQRNNGQPNQREGEGGVAMDRGNQWTAARSVALAHSARKEGRKEETNDSGPQSPGPASRGRRWRSEGCESFSLY